MVQRGQFLERPALVACGPLTLEGLWHRGSRAPALLLCPAPGPGGGMDAPVVAELAWACARAGFPSLRFQHRGAGASEGEADPARAVEDAEAALGHLAASAPGPLAVAGYLGGCETALALARAHPELRAVILVAPPGAPGPLDLPVLVVLPGSEDAGWRAAVAGAPRARVELLPDSDAGFARDLTRVGALVAEFLACG